MSAATRPETREKLTPGQRRVIAEAHCGKTLGRRTVAARRLEAMGLGRIISYEEFGYFHSRFALFLLGRNHVCWRCNATGVADGQPCSRCDGIGALP